MHSCCFHVSLNAALTHKHVQHYSWPRVFHTHACGAWHREPLLARSFHTCRVEQEARVALRSKGQVQEMALSLIHPWLWNEIQSSPLCIRSKLTCKRDPWPQVTDSSCFLYSQPLSWMTVVGWNKPRVTSWSEVSPPLYSPILNPLLYSSSFTILCKVAIAPTFSSFIMLITWDKKRCTSLISKLVQNNCSMDMLYNNASCMYGNGQAILCDLVSFVYLFVCFLV